MEGIPTFCCAVGMLLYSLQKNCPAFGDYKAFKDLMLFTEL